MTITQTVDIPESRKLTFDVPREVPAGRAQVEIKVIPFVKKENKLEPPLKCLIGVKTPLADSLLGVAANLGNTTLSEIREERLAKHFV